MQSSCGHNLPFGAPSFLHPLQRDHLSNLTNARFAIILLPGSTDARSLCFLYSARSFSALFFIKKQGILTRNADEATIKRVLCLKQILIIQMLVEFEI